MSIALEVRVTELERRLEILEARWRIAEAVALDTTARVEVRGVKRGRPPLAPGMKRGRFGHPVPIPGWTPPPEPEVA